MNTTEATQNILDEVMELPDEKLALFFLNLFGASGLEEMAFDLIEGQLDRGQMTIETDEDIQKFINTMII